MVRMKLQSVTALFIVMLVCYAANALGQEREFPVRPINLYLGFAPGGGATHTGTVAADGMKKYLKQPVILNSKPGAAQAIAAEFVKNSNPDGYTLFWVAFADLETKMAKDRSSLKFGLEDLDSLGAAPYTPYALVVNDESPWKTVEDLLSAARKSPGKLSHGSSGVGALTHIAAELFSMKTGIVLNHVPFAGGGPAITALLGKHVDIGFASVGTYGGHIKPGGGLRALAVFDRKRDFGLPDVPTTIERGIDITLTSWFGLQAPKSLPKSVRATLIEAFKNAVNDPQIISMLTKLGFNISYYSPEEVDRRVQEEYRQFQAVWKNVGSIK